jgi:hypothetical protein
VVDLCKDLISLYKSKTHGGLDVELCQLFKNDGLGELVFFKGVSTNLWTGFLQHPQSHPGHLFSLLVQQDAISFNEQ